MTGDGNQAAQALMGMLKTNPKDHTRIELVLDAS